MGQYFHAGVNELKKCVNTHDYLNGAKLMEHSWIGNNYVNVVEKLIAPDGKWFGKSLTWGGDYAEKGDVNPDTYDYKKINPKETEYHYFRFLINETTKQFVDLDKTPITDTVGYKIHPLPLLTCNSNGNGGGDFYGNDNNNIVGTWAGNIITVSDVLPTNDYTELIFDLVE